MATPNLEKENVGLRKKPLTSSKRGIIQVLCNVDMRNRHEGLTQIAKDHGIDVDTLEPGQYVIFINALKTSVSVFAANGVLACQRSKSGKLQMEVISKIPEAFNGRGFSYDEALKEVLEGILKRKKENLN